jgi:hypothetical protein
MKKSEAEKQIRHLTSVWRSLDQHRSVDEQDLSFTDFYRWLRDNYPQLVKFKSVMPVEEVVEQWFDQEFHQTWRN